MKIYRFLYPIGLLIRIGYLNQQLHQVFCPNLQLIIIIIIQNSMVFMHWICLHQAHFLLTSSYQATLTHDY